MKDIKGYEGLYAVTSCGRVWSYRNNRFLKAIKNTKTGYWYVNLYKNKVATKYYIHRLVAEAYIPNINNLPEINHKSEDKSQNFANNLEWCDRTYNINYATRNERAAKALSVQIYCIELNEIFNSSHDAARQLNINQGHIWECCNGKRKTEGGYHWSYTDEVLEAHL